LATQEDLQRNRRGALHPRDAIRHQTKHKTDREHQVWQEGSHPEQIEGEAMMLQKLEYIHNDPVARGYVDEPIHWRYSSARNYVGMPGLIEVTTEW
jgi:hypothetical protein